jgi:hypothetical protein
LVNAQNLKWRATAMFLAPVLASARLPIKCASSRTREVSNSDENALDRTLIVSRRCSVPIALTRIRTPG